jgi:hypothetical protein
MAKKPDGASAGTQRVTFTRPAAERIGKVVREVEAGNRDLGPLEWGPRGVGGSSSKVFRVATVSGAWELNTLRTVTFRNQTTTPNTASVMNHIMPLPAMKSTGASRIVNIAKDHTQWYLVSFPLVTATAVLSTGTQTITFFGTGATQTVTFVGAGATQTISYPTLGPTVNALVDVSAVLNTNNCTITVNKTTTSVQTVGGTQSATVVNMSGTQTATILSMSSTQTATVFSGTFTATYITLEL